ncbi:DUF4129 domain-containing protein [Luteimonas viscosa]|uniref:DUF4129 domain-containing protein n=1 Tax=Luteimonas viscosa TaxID=1132694 RepID=A0A5D4XS79_9GAMM|nr:DUF4129 domain-containing protein [Luteimonas viscosa]TYT26803.1 DUF4129 domain-containing protein [Luteimonas viscosa]
MRLDQVRVELRPRLPWEAVELGMALVRRHAGAIWRPWAAATLPLFVLLNAAAWAIDALWLAALAMWWLLPLFDRIVLFVLSRAVFDEPPTPSQTLAAQRGWGWRGIGARLSWARLSPWRCIAMPVELLEGIEGEALRARRRIVIDGIQGHAFLLALVCQLFVLSLLASLLSLVLMFVPAELLSESARAMWALVVDEPPRGAQLAFNAALWLALSIIEPFLVGAGFGLYLSRRVRIEAWDIELALRRMRARLAQVAGLALATCLLGLVLLAPPPAAAQATQRIQDERERAAHLPPKSPEAGPVDGEASTLERVFGEDAVVDDRPFRQAVKRAYEDPLLDRSRVERSWERRDRSEPEPPSKAPPWLLAAGRVIAVIGEYGLWLLLGLLLLALALTAKRWWPWMRGLRAAPTPESAIVQVAAPDAEALPADLAAAARRLWREGRPRRALALLYRGSVEAMVARAGVTLVPGATEAQCLRASRGLPDADDRNAFARMVRVWQYAAYARHLPAEEEFESLLGELSQRFGWAR